LVSGSIGALAAALSMQGLAWTVMLTVAAAESAQPSLAL